MFTKEIRIISILLCMAINNWALKERLTYFEHDLSSLNKKIKPVAELPKETREVGAYGTTITYVHNIQQAVGTQGPITIILGVDLPNTVKTRDGFSSTHLKTKLENFNETVTMISTKIMDIFAKEKRIENNDDYFSIIPAKYINCGDWVGLSVENIRELVTHFEKVITDFSKKYAAGMKMGTGTSESGPLDNISLDSLEIDDTVPGFMRLVVASPKINHFVIEFAISGGMMAKRAPLGVADKPSFPIIGIKKELPFSYVPRVLITTTEGNRWSVSVFNFAEWAKDLLDRATVNIRAPSVTLYWRTAGGDIPLVTYAFKQE